MNEPVGVTVGLSPTHGSPARFRNDCGEKRCRRTMWRSFLDTLPRGYTLDESDWRRRHRLLLRLLAGHVPALAVYGLVIDTPWSTLAWVLLTPASCVAIGWVLRRSRRAASVIVTLGLVWCSGALVGFSGGAIEAHFHFFIIIGFIALYQDWAPFLCNIGFVVISHGIGSIWQQSLIFAHSSGQQNPWLWSLIHGGAVLFACVGMMLFWRFTEESQQEKETLARQLSEAEIGRRQFTSDLLVNLARRNQSLLYRQLDIINQLEESEQDPDVLAELFALDHLATRVRRNAESLLVLSGEQPPRTWSGPVPLRDVLRASIAETENLDRVVFSVDDRLAVLGHSVTDLTHLLAELTENAVRFSPPDTVVTIRARADRSVPGAHVLAIEDLGVGMPPEDLAAANALLADPPEIDLSVSQRLGLHVIARLAARHGVRVSLTPTPGSGITAVVALPAELFGSLEPVPAPVERPPAPPAPLPVRDRDRDRGEQRTNGNRAAVLTREPGPFGSSGPFGSDGRWEGWWQPEDERTEAVPQTPPSGRPTPPPLGRLGAALPAERPGTPGTWPARPPAAAPPPAAPPAAPPPVVPEPRSRTADTGVPAITNGLRRRVPQTNLAPELRTPPPSTGPGPDPAQAADAAGALSRYQASRQAAQDATENGHQR